MPNIPLALNGLEPDHDCVLSHANSQWLTLLVISAAPKGMMKLITKETELSVIRAADEQPHYSKPVEKLLTSLLSFYAKEEMHGNTNQCRYQHGVGFLTIRLLSLYQCKSNTPDQKRTAVCESASNPQSRLLNLNVGRT